MNKLFLSLFLIGATALYAAKYSMELSLVEHPDGYYRQGETITCKGRVLLDGKPLETGDTCVCNIKFEGKIQEKIQFKADGAFHEFTTKAPRPGWSHFGFEILDAEGKARKGDGITRFGPKPTIFGEIGAITDAEKIRTDIQCPEDFITYWNKVREAIYSLPIEADVQELEVPDTYKDKETGKPQIKVYAVTVNCPTDRPVTGYLAVPADKNKNLPAVIEFLSWSWVDANKNAAMSRAARGQLSMYCSWHGLPLGKEKEFYTNASKSFGALQGCEDKDTWIFRNCALRVLRALAYIEQRPEWDGRNLAVMGGSLGGFETSIAAAVDKKVTLAIISVPGFCEFDGVKSNRMRSIPFQGRNGDKATPKAMEAMAYYDCVNFAKFITCETYVCTGFADDLCPPPNVFAMYNNIPASTPKEMTTNPLTGHYGTTKNVKGNKRIEEYLRGITVRKFTDY